MSKSKTCPRCGGPHGGRDCSAPFGKSWKGQWAFKGTVRTPDGTNMEFMMPLGEHGPGMLDRLLAIASGKKVSSAAP